MGVKLGGADALVAEQRLDIHQFRAGVEKIGRVGVAQLGAIPTPTRVANS